MSADGRLTVSTDGRLAASADGRLAASADGRLAASAGAASAFTKRPMVIAIDGPSGSGKSSVSRAVAQHLGLAYLDTGAMFRALTWWCAQEGIDLEDLALVAQAARDLPLMMGTNPDAPSVQVAGVAIDEAIRTTEISASVSKVATNLEVRTELCARQRALIAESMLSSGGVVAEGRDITTVVAPDADVRILLVASQQARLARRAKELHGEAGHAAVSATHDQIVRRDRDDSTVSEFMNAAPGVTVVDTSELDFEQSVDAVLAVVAASVGPRMSHADEGPAKIRDNG